MTQTYLFHKPCYNKQYVGCFKCSFPCLWLTLLICYYCQINGFPHCPFSLSLYLVLIPFSNWFFRHIAEECCELNLFSYLGEAKPWRQQSRINLPFPAKTVGHPQALKAEMLISGIASLNPEKLLWLL